MTVENITTISSMVNGGIDTEVMSLRIRRYVTAIGSFRERSRSRNRRRSYIVNTAGRTSTASTSSNPQDDTYYQRKSQVCEVCLLFLVVLWYNSHFILVVSSQRCGSMISITNGQIRRLLNSSIQWLAHFTSTIAPLTVHVTVCCEFVPVLFRVCIEWLC